MMKKEGSITVFSALSFMLIASFLFALLEAGRMYQLKTYARMRSELAIESVCAEYQPGLWQDYRILCLDGSYGGKTFSMDYVTGVLGARIRTNLEQEGAGSRILGLKLDMASPKDYQLLTDGDGSVFLSCISEYMKKNLPAETAKILYNKYKEGEAMENSQQTEQSVENAQTAIEEAKKAKAQTSDEAAGNQSGTTGDGTAVGGTAGDGIGNTTAGGSQNTEEVMQAGGEQTVEEVKENPLEVVLALKQNALLGMVTGNVGSLSTKQISKVDTLEHRTCEKGTLAQIPKADWYDKVLVVEYLDEYFADYSKPASGHALSYELEYVLCGKESDKDNLEGVVNRLLLMRMAANVTHILSDGTKKEDAMLMANALAGFTGNPAVIQVVQIGIIAAWAYVESILDIRALLEGDRVALLKNNGQWMTQLGSLTKAFADGTKTNNCTDGLSYQDYLKGFLFTMGNKKLAYRMMDIMEQNLHLVSAYRNCRMDHMLCQINYDLAYVAEPLFWNFVTVGKSKLTDLQFQNSQSFSYY